MTAAFGIGYDWLYDQWTADQRQVLRTAIVELGLQQGLKVYQPPRKAAGTTSQHNWNQVCNGGMTIGALAVADEEPEIWRARSWRHAIRSVPRAMQNFAPDGAWGEGPGYWSYATQYNVAMLAALESALGTDYGLSAIPGFSEAGTFPIYLTGPLDRTFDFADADAGTPRSAATCSGSPASSTGPSTRRSRSPMPSRRRWTWCSTIRADISSIWPRCRWTKYFRDAEVGIFRSAWNDRNALWVAFKAGSNAVNHSHLDLGTFVLEALGQRWFVDLGADDYNLPGYFGASAGITIGCGPKATTRW